MKRLIASIGLILIIAPLTATAQQESLYQYVKQMTEQELFPAKGAEEVIKTFIPIAYPGLEKEIKELDIDAALQQHYRELCAGKEKTGYYGACLDAAKRIGRMADDENRVRAFGRELQLIALGYEATLQGQIRDIFLQLASIINIWQSASDRYRSPVVEPRVRKMEFPPWKKYEEFKGYVKKIGKILKDLPEEEQEAIIWRYEYGLSGVRGDEKDCSDDEEKYDGTELQLVRKRWCDIEEVMENILDLLPDLDEYEPPLEPNEVVIFENADVGGDGALWLRSDDVGLSWSPESLKLIHPVLPSLDCTEVDGEPPEECVCALVNGERPDECDERAILGGVYPTEEDLKDPEPYTGLCKHPFGRLSYLCRPIETDWCVAGATDDYEPIEKPPSLSNCCDAYDNDCDGFTDIGEDDECKDLTSIEEEEGPGNMIKDPDDNYFKMNMYCRGLYWDSIELKNDVDFQDRIFNPWWSDLENVKRILFEIWEKEGMSFPEGEIEAAARQWIESIKNPTAQFPLSGNYYGLREQGLDWGEFLKKKNDGTLNELLGIECTKDDEEGGSKADKKGQPIYLTECRVPPFRGELEPEDVEAEEEDEKKWASTGTGTPLSTFATPSGPNICTTGGWRIGPEYDEDEEEDGEKLSCRNCRVKVSCETDCDDADGMTYPKSRDNEDDGLLEVCINKKNDYPFTYTLIHELTHAQDLCNNPIFDIDTESPYGGGVGDDCCAVEYRAHTVSCNAQAEDGVFDGSDITVEMCAMVGANLSCYQHRGDKPCTFDSFGEYNAMSMTEQLRVQIAKAGIENPAAVDTTCSEDPADWDARAQQIYFSMPGMCNPECQSEYANTIGNNFCFLGQCIEQSWEEHRALPGRTAYTADGQAYPFDSCSPPDPGLGSLMQLPPVSIARFPPYNPRELVVEVDKALCQANGMPALTPPVRCNVDAQRRLDIPLMTHLTTGMGLAQRPGEISTPVLGLEQLAPSIGSRLGSELYTNYLSTSAQIFAELIQAADGLQVHIAQMSFSPDMCPRYASKYMCPYTPQ